MMPWLCYVQGIHVLNYIDDSQTSPVPGVSNLASRCRPCSSEVLGVVTEHQKECQRTTYLRVVLDSISMQAHLSPAQGRVQAMSGDPCQPIPEAVGSYGGCHQHDTFGAAVHKSISVVTQKHHPLCNRLKKIRFTCRGLQTLGT